MTKRRYIINFVIVIVLAVVSGYFIGSFIAGGKLLALSNTYNELVLRKIVDEENKGEEEIPNYFSELPSSYFTSISTLAQGKTPDKLTAIEAYMVAEYITNTQPTIYKKIDGVIKAKSMGVSIAQSLISTKTKKDGKITIEKISYSSMAKVAFKIEHTLDNDKYFVTEGTATSGTTADWKTPTEKNIADYRTTFGNGIDYFTNYLVSPKTVANNQYSKVVKSGDNYTFSLALDISINEQTGAFVYGGVSNYMYEIKDTAGAEDFPVFNYCNLKVTIDSNYRFVKLEIEEQYDIVAFGFRANTTGIMTETFIYE